MFETGVVRDNTVELQWLEHLRDHGYMFETGAVRDNTVEWLEHLRDHGNVRDRGSSS